MFVPRESAVLVVRTDVDCLDALMVPLGDLDACVASTDLDVNFVTPPSESIVACLVEQPTCELLIKNVNGLNVKARCFLLSECLTDRGDGGV